MQERSVACQDVSQGVFHHFGISFRQRPKLSDNQSVVEGESLKADFAGYIEASFPPVLDRHIARPIAPG